MVGKLVWVLMALLAIAIGFYPAMYLFVDKNFGLLSSKPGSLLESLPWNIAFYTHIVLGGIALLTGWVQFSKRIRNRYLSLHRQLGKVYVVAVFMSASAGFYIAMFATGGIIAITGFASLAIIWFYSTSKAYIYIRKQQVARHRELMIYSYAACFAAVTLRLWLPSLMAITGDFTTSYLIVSWLCWVPNLIVARLIVNRSYRLSPL